MLSRIVFRYIGFPVMLIANTTLLSSCSHTPRSPYQKVLRYCESKSTNHSIPQPFRPEFDQEGFPHDKPSDTDSDAAFSECMREIWGAETSYDQDIERIEK